MMSYPKTVLICTSLALATMLGVYSATANSGDTSDIAPAIGLASSEKAETVETSVQDVPVRKVIRIVGASYLPNEDQSIPLLGAAEARAARK